MCYVCAMCTAAYAEWLTALTWGQEEEFARTASDAADMMKEGVDLQVGALTLICYESWVEIRVAPPCLAVINRGHGNTHWISFLALSPGFAGYDGAHPVGMSRWVVVPQVDTGCPGTGCPATARGIDAV